MRASAFLGSNTEQASLPDMEMTTKKHPVAFFDSDGILRSWTTAEPMPQGWTGIAKHNDTLFVVGRDGKETSYAALMAKTMVGARSEAVARNL